MLNPTTFHQNQKEVWAVLYRQEWFWFVTFQPLVTLKIRSHGLKSNQFLTHSQGVSPPSFIKIDPVVLAQLCTRDSRQMARQMAQNLYVYPRGEGGHNK